MYRFDATELGAFLKRTVPEMLKSAPNLEPKVIVGTAVLMWAGGIPR
jgi:hypothetical protein